CRVVTSAEGGLPDFADVWVTALTPESLVEASLGGVRREHAVRAPEETARGVMALYERARRGGGKGGSSAFGTPAMPKAFSSKSSSRRFGPPRGDGEQRSRGSAACKGDTRDGSRREWSRWEAFSWAARGKPPPSFSWRSGLRSRAPRWSSFLAGMGGVR